MGCTDETAEATLNSFALNTQTIPKTVSEARAQDQEAEAAFSPLEGSEGRVETRGSTQ